MFTYRDDSVEARQPAVEAQGSAFLATVLQGPVVQEIPNVPLAGATEGFILHYASRNSVVLPAVTDRMGRLHSDGASLLMQALHASFAEHVPFSISPDMVWYLILHEVAVHIRLNQDQYRGFFTTSDQKGTILVRDDSLRYGGDNQWGRSINLVRDPLRAVIPQATMDLCLLKFSTSTFESETALLVLFLDMVSNYYGLMWQTMCGIPAIRVEGTAADWQLIVNQAEQLQKEFSGLHPYFADLLPVLKEMAGTVAGAEPDPEFWKSIYKYEGGSGGPYINGWITAFYAHTMTPSGFVPRESFDWRQSAKRPFGGFTASDFPTHLTVVPFKWDYFGRVINMAFMAGVMGVEYDGHLNPRLGYGVLEDVRGKLTAAAE